MLINYKNSDSRKVSIGGKSVSVKVAPRETRMGAETAPKRKHGHFSLVAFLGYFYAAIRSLTKGMGITLSFFLRPSTVITQQYPENRSTLKMFDRYRARLKFKVNDEGLHNCPGCRICEKACPNVSIIVNTQKSEIHGRQELDTFVWRWDCCTFCNVCVQVCPFDALEMTGQFESSVYDRRLLVANLNEYAGPSRDVVEKARKKNEKVDELLASKNARRQFEGNLPLSGKSMAGVAALSINTKTGDGSGSHLAKKNEAKEETKDETSNV